MAKFNKRMGVPGNKIKVNTAPRIAAMTNKSVKANILHLKPRRMLAMPKKPKMVSMRKGPL